jgi:membrane dipeptidase
LATLPIIDLHEDLLPHIEARTLYGDVWQTSWKGLEQSPVRIVFASTWPGYGDDGVVSDAARATNERYMRDYAAVTEDSGTWSRILEAGDVDRALAGESRGIVVHVEGVPHPGGPVEAMFERWHSLGCRSVGLMWNDPNGFGFGPWDPDQGLSDDGRAAVRWLDRNPVVLDTAHMGETTFWDTLDATSGPVVTTHANARAICDHPRNLWDDQLRAIAERDGVVGLVFSTRFLGGAADVSRVVDHAEHMLSVVGERHVAIGSDLGGMLEDCMAEIDRVEIIGRLLEAMAARGFPGATVEAIASGNAARALRASLGKTPG